MKLKKTMKETTDGRTYRLSKIRWMKSCPICSVHRGCNRNRDYIRSWKEFRTTQYKKY